MVQLQLRLDDGRHTTRITLPKASELTLTADDIENLIRALGWKRSLMLPKVPREFSGSDEPSPENPRWEVLSREGEQGGALLVLRDPRYGWISYAFDGLSLQELLTALNNIHK